MNHQKTALMTGVNGRDGGYLAEFLLDLGYTVPAIWSRTSMLNTSDLELVRRDKMLFSNRPEVLKYED